MGYVVDELHKLGAKQINYAESPKGSNRTKYGVYWDTPKSKGGPYPWFNGKKNGECGWCALYTNWEIVMVIAPLVGGTDKAREWLGYPKPSQNAAAGAPEMYSYLKKWKVDKTKGQPGDIIFLNTLGSCSHVGRIDNVANGNYYTVEGNKGDCVGTRTLSINSSLIYAVIHPPYDKLEPQPEPEPLPIPTPEPTPVADNLYRVVNIKTFLAIRSEPSANGKKLGELYNDAIVTVLEKKNGWARITGTSWVYMSYLKKV